MYEGGDDAVAFKPNSTNIHVENVTVYGGPGIAFGSLGQYPDRYDIVENITVKNANVSRRDEMLQDESTNISSFNRPPNER